MRLADAPNSHAISAGASDDITAKPVVAHPSNTGSMGLVGFLILWPNDHAYFLKSGGIMKECELCELRRTVARHEIAIKALKKSEESRSLDNLRSRDLRAIELKHPRYDQE